MSAHSGTISSSRLSERSIQSIEVERIPARPMATLAESEPDYGRSIRRGVIGGSILGAAMGAALVLFSASSAFNNWGGILSIPISGAFGWGLYGWILGGSGVLAGRGERKSGYSK